MKNWILFPTLGILALLCLVFAGGAYWIGHPQKNLQTIIILEKGDSLAQITTQLVEKQLLTAPLFFKAILYGMGEWAHLKAGEYLIPPAVTPLQLINILKSGNVILHRLTLIEGETSYQFTERLLKDERFKGPCKAPPEGSLLPETYIFSRGTDRQYIILHMQKAMQQAVAKLWTQRPQDHPLRSPDELVVLASIIEKETSLLREKSLVAAVFLNRLKQEKRLQADPTILYALTNGKETLGRALTRQDLQTQSPYNTYLHKGLPPTPITNPGFASLKAALCPADVSYLYFVADGSGGHVFATLLEDHSNNHKAWRKIRKAKYKH